MKQGKLIIVEGTDCAGKSTLVDTLWKDLSFAYNNLWVIKKSEPFWKLPHADNRTAQILLQSAQRIELYNAEIKPALEDDMIVIVDRSYLSTYVYNCKEPEDYKLTTEMVERFIDKDLLRDAIWVVLTPSTIQLANQMIQRARADKLDADEEDFGVNCERNEGYREAVEELKMSGYEHVYNITDTQEDTYLKLLNKIKGELDKNEKR